MKVCLIKCPSPFLIDENVMPPLGLMAVGTSLKEKGHEVYIYDGKPEDVPLNFAYYGFGPTTPEYGYALQIKKLIKYHNPKAKIIIGGPHVIVSEDSLNDGWDCVVIGDGEEAAEKAFLGYEKIIRSQEESLDKYPIIDRKLLNLKKYDYKINGIPATTIVTSRGCPYKCAFCCKIHCGLRMASVEKIIKEIEYLHGLGYRALMFFEDIFTIDKKRAEEIFAKLKELQIVSRCFLRADGVVRNGIDYLKMMRQSGCAEVGIGVESGSNKILKTIRKGEDIDTITLAIKMIRAAEIRVKGFLILGLPGESKETIQETKDFLDTVKMEDMDIKIYQPYPGSYIWNNKDKFDIDWDDIDYKDMFYKGEHKKYFGSVRTSQLTTEELYKEWVQMESEYCEFT